MGVGWMIMVDGDLGAVPSEWNPGPCASCFYTRLVSWYTVDGSTV